MSLVCRLAMLLLLTGSVFAQQQVLYFSTRFAETPASGRGGFIADQAAPCLPIVTFGTGFAIESAIANSQGLNFVVPGTVNSTVLNSLPAQDMVDFVEVSNFPQFNVYIGDLDGDGIPHESTNFRGIDAAYIPAGVPGRPNNIHEIFVSCWGDSTGNMGFIGTELTEADIFLLPAASTAYPVQAPPTAPIFFARQADWEVLLGLPGTTNSLDIDAFTVDAATGDIYFSIDGSAGVSGAQLVTSPGTAAVTMSMQRGDIVRIPAAAYTPSGPLGVVTAPISGLAELVYSAADVTAMVSLAGGTINASGSTNVYGLSIDPSGAAAATPSGFTVRDLIFTVDNRGGAQPGTPNPSASAVYSTLANGSYAVINGVTMDQPNSAGLNNSSFNGGFYAGPMDAISIVQQNFSPISDRPLHLDTFPTNGIVSDPVYNGIVTCYISGLPPGGVVEVYGRFDFIPAAGYVSRTSVAGAVGGYPDLYVDPFGISNQNCVVGPPLSIFGPLCQNPISSIVVPLFNNAGNGSVNPIQVHTDLVNGRQNGDTCFSLNLSTLIPAGALPPQPTINLTFQALDLSLVRLSSPVSLQLN